MTTAEPARLKTPLAWHVAAVAAAMLFPTLTTLLYFHLLAGSESMAAAYALTKVVQFAFPAVWVLLVQRHKPRWRRPTADGLLWGIGLAAAGVVIMLTAFFGYFQASRYLAEAPHLVTAKVMEMKLSTPARFLAFAAFLSILHSLLEEYYWRWFVFGQLERVVSLRTAVTLSSLAFMAHHVIVIYQFVPYAGAAALFSLAVAVGGAVWAWLYHRHGSLWSPWLSHLLIDCGIMFIGYNLIQFN